MKMENPADLKYSKEHEWVKVEGDVGVIGVTDFAQKQLTDIVFVELPDKGKKVEKDKQMAVIESVKSVSDVFSPVRGEVIEVNEKLKDNPDVINKDPYGEGWIVKVKIENKDELNDLMSAEDYGKFIEEKRD
jgi:glycine cleavage system H protein